MNKSKIVQLFLVITIAIISILLIYRFVRNKVIKDSFALDIRKEKKSMFDSINSRIQKDHHLYYDLQKSIINNDSLIFFSLIDTLYKLGRNSDIHLYRGMFLVSRSRYLEGIKQYDSSMAINDFCLGLSKRAEAFLKIDRIDLALIDYKKAYEINYDFSLQLARVYRMENDSDSSSKYYKAYLKNYPNDTMVIEEAKRRIK